MPRPALLRPRRKPGHTRAIVTVLAGLLAVGASLATGAQMNPVDGFFYDLSLAATQKRPGSGGRPVAVIALDRKSLDSEALKPWPRAFLSPIWARLLDGLVASGVRAVGFDIIFQYSADRLPGGNGRFDRPFLLALQRARDRVVLARSARAVPAPPYFAALLDPGADIDLTADLDGIIRRMTPSVATTNGPPVPTFAASRMPASAIAKPLPGMRKPQFG